MAQYNLPTPHEIAKDTVSGVSALLGDWGEYTVMHQYDAKSISSDFIFDINDSKAVGFSLDKFDGVNGAVASELSGSRLIDKSDCGDRITIGRGYFRPHVVLDSRIVFQFNGTNQGVDRSILNKGFRNKCPDRMLNLTGFYEFKNDGKDIIFSSCSEDDSVEMMDEWVMELVKRSELSHTNNPITQIALYDMIEHFELNEITHMSQLSSDLGFSTRTLYKYRELLGF